MYLASCTHPKFSHDEVRLCLKKKKKKRKKQQQQLAGFYDLSASPQVNLDLVHVFGCIT